MGNHAVRYKDLPEVCKSCRFSDDDAKDEYSPNYYFCTKGLYLPTKKNSCKVKDKLRKGQASEYEFREIGESEWTPCDKDWFDYCQKSPEHDARLRKEQEHV